jgi:hypothetical protein
MLKTEYNANLYEHVCEVKFEKADGTIRTMLCTLKPDVIQKLIQPVTEDATTEPVVKKTVPDYQIRCIDVEKMQWRSFNIDSIRSFVIIE